MSHLSPTVYESLYAPEYLGADVVQLIATAVIVMNRIATMLGVSGLAFGLAGCVTGAPTTTYHTDDPYSFLAYYASHGGVPIMVVGDPYPGRRAEVERAAVAAFERNFRSLGDSFRATPPTRGGFNKVVFVFNRPTPATVQSVCRDPAEAGGGGATQTMTVAVVYCATDTPFSDYWMTFPTPSAPSDPVFQQRLAEVAYFAVPREINPAKRNSSATPPG
jgi:hypothetical protein